MKRKLMTALVALVLVVSLVSCDAVVNIMGKMGTNIAGADTQMAETAVESVKVAEEDKTEKKEVATDESGTKKIGKVDVAEGSTFTYGEDNKELYSVGKTEDNTPVLGIGSEAVYLDKVSEDTKKALDEITTVLPPQDISSVTSALDGGSKDETVKKLSEPISDETTKEAAGGTKTVVAALLEEVSKNVLGEAPADGTEEDKTKSQARVVVNKILENIKADEDGNTKDLTLGDLVVLQTITNVISETSDTLLGVITETGSEEDVTNMLETSNDTIVAAASILNSISSSTTMFEGVDLEALLSIVL